MTLIFLPVHVPRLNFEFLHLTRCRFLLYSDLGRHNILLLEFVVDFDWHVGRLYFRKRSNVGTIELGYPIIIFIDSDDYFLPGVHS